MFSAMPYPCVLDGPTMLSLMLFSYFTVSMYDKYIRDIYLKTLAAQ